MKKIFSIALAATLLAAGCQKTEVIGLDDSKTGPAMTFSTEMKKITKVGTSDANAQGVNDNLQAQGFNIWAFADYDLANATNVDRTSLVYDNMEGWFVDYASGAWNPNKQYYWPGTGKDLRFFAVSLATVEEIAGDVTSRKPNFTVTPEHGIGTTTGPKITIKNFQVEVPGTNSAPNEDLMVADFVKQNQSNKKVTLNFHHALSKVQFLFKTTPELVEKDGETVEVIPNVTVNSISIQDLETKGTLVVTNSDEPFGTLVDSDFKWTEENNLQDFEKTKEMRLGKEPSVYDTWLMLPQTITSKKITIAYKIDNRDFEVIFNLTGNKDGFTSWNRNQYVRYTIDISPNKIKFDASSTPWENYDGDNDGFTGDKETPGQDDINMNN